jgi:hypothetical protein
MTLQIAKTLSPIPVITESVNIPVIPHGIVPHYLSAMIGDLPMCEPTGEFPNLF